MIDMRDPKRIARICKNLEKCWMNHPDMRFCQLLINYGLAEDSNRLWNVEDDIVEDKLTFSVNELYGKPKNKCCCCKISKPKKVKKK